MNSIYRIICDRQRSFISAVREGRLERVEELISYYNLADSSKGRSDGYVLLRDALKNNHSEVAKLLLTNGSKVNGENKIPSVTPLHLAVRNGDIEIVQMLLDKGADVAAECEYGATPLHVAVQTKRMEITKLLLSRGANVNAEGNYRITMFYNAMLRRNEEMLEDLSEHGIHPNSLRSSTLLPESFTPLHVAVRNGNEEIIKLLLNRGANVNAKGKDGITPLHVAMEEGDLQIVEHLLNHGACVNSAYTSSSLKGYTPLCIAVINRHEEVIKLLLERGANVNAQDQDGKTILHFAVEDRCSLIIEHLLRYSPDVNKNSNKCPLNIVVHGCEKNYSKIVKNLLQYGFKVDFSDEDDCKSLSGAVLKEYQKINEEHCECDTDVNVIPVTTGILPKPESFRTPFIHKNITELLIQDGAAVYSDAEKTPIFYAAEKNCREIIEVLLQHGAGVNSSDECGKGPFSEELLEGPLDKVLDISEKTEIARLHFRGISNKAEEVNLLYLAGDYFPQFIKPCEIVSENSNLEIVEVLLKFVDFKDKDGRTVLHVASDYSNLEIVEVLLKFGAGTDSEGEHGATAATPVHIASKRSKPEIVEVLSRFGADVNSKDQYGRTALHIASENSNLEMVETLLKFGAGVDFRDENGKTALHVASENSNAQIVEVLLKFDSDIDSKDHCGRTALHIASRTCNLEIVEILLKNGAGADFKDKRGRTALYIASRWSNLQIVELLLKFGAGIHLKDDGLQTPFHIASLQNKREIHEVLLKFGADIDSKDKNGATALHIASENSNLEIVEALLKFGASVDSKDKDGRTALCIACKNRNYEIAIVLLDHGSDIPIVSETEDSRFCVDMNRGYSDDDGYNFLVPRNISQSFKYYAVKVKAANLYVRNKNLASIRSDDEVSRDVQKECENEVASMKSEVVGNTNISFYDILTKGLSQLAIYAGNESIVQVFRSDDYKRKFPIYATLINSRFRNGERRRELMVQGNKIFHSLFTNFLGIPYDCTEKIFKYLSNDDLRSIVHACKPISVSSLNTDKK